MIHGVSKHFVTTREDAPGAVLPQLSKIPPALGCAPREKGVWGCVRCQSQILSESAFGMSLLVLDAEAITELGSQDPFLGQDRIALLNLEEVICSSTVATIAILISKFRRFD